MLTELVLKQLNLDIMATTMKIFATVGTLLAVHLLVSVFFFFFSIGNPYSDGDMFLRGIIGLPLWMQLLGGVLITFAVLYGAVNKKKLNKKARTITWKFFSGE